MQTRSSSRLISNPSSNPTPSTNPNLKSRNHRRSKQRIEEFNLDELSPPIVTMAGQHTMAQLLQAPTEGYEDAIVVPAITADHFELKHGILTLVQNKQFFGHDKEDPHAHVRYFNKITSTLKFPNVSNTVLMNLLVKHGIDSKIFFEPVLIMVPLILGRSFLKTKRALIDVFEGELTLRVGKEAIPFNIDQTSRYSANYSDMIAKRIDVIDMACEEYSQEVLGFSDVIISGNPTPYYDPIVSTTSSTLTPFGNSDFLLEEVDAFLAIEDDPTSPKVSYS
uniref:Reverse transcriptase domain-containing protein n=1 Tax=Tanacetum cinerariifolium TaxID=118510 RepID=A0A6L2MPH8_TANCI|nr:reverse transcriptase domain-containing protein [Tanacetum cinerariifolium]